MRERGGVEQDWGWGTAQPGWCVEPGAQGQDDNVQLQILGGDQDGAMGSTGDRPPTSAHTPRVAWEGMCPPNLGMGQGHMRTACCELRAPRSASLPPGPPRGEPQACSRYPTYTRHTLPIGYIPAMLPTGEGCPGSSLHSGHSIHCSPWVSVRAQVLLGGGQGPWSHSPGSWGSPLAGLGGARNYGS